MTSEVLIKHEITIDNTIIGEARLIRLALPEGWHLAPGISHPEVAATHKRSNSTWVVSGAAWYVVYNEDNGWAMELAVRLSPGRAKQSAPETGAISAGGHPARVSNATKRRGLPWKRHDVRFVTVDYYCPQSDRQLELEFSGWCPDQGFQEMLEALHHLGCH